MGSSSSSSAPTTNTDKRLVTGQNSIGISSDNSNVTLQMLDGGIVSKALETVQLSDVVTGQGFDRLLTAAESLFNQGQKMIGQTQSAVQDAYQQAQDNTKSTIDNRTVIVLGVAAAATVGIFALRKK